MPGVANADALLAQCEWVRQLVRHLVFDRDVADDVVQQTYLAALEHPPATLESPRGWLAQVARRFVFQTHRKEARRRRSEIVAARTEAQTAEPDVAHRLEMHRKLVEAVSSLDPPYRAVVVMRYFDGLAPRDIAARLGLPATTVRNRLSRGLDQLRSRLDGDYGGRKAWSLALLPLSLGRTASGAGIPAASAIAVLVAAGVIAVVLVASRESEKPEYVGEGQRLVIPDRSDPGPAKAGGPGPAAGGPEAASPEAAALRGRVLDRDGQPAAGARVSVHRPLRQRAYADDWFTRSSHQFAATVPVAETTADADGAWSFPTLASEVYDVVAEVPATARTLAEGIEAGPRTKPVDLVLEPVELVPCVVVDAEGNPVPDAEIAVHHQKSFDPHFNRPRTELLRSDGSGRFTIARARGTLVDARQVVIERFQGAGCWQEVSLRSAGFAPIFAAPLSRQQIDAQGRVAFVMQRGRRFTISFRSDESIDEPLRCMLRLESARYEAVTTTDESQDATFDDVPAGAAVAVILDTPGWALMRKPVVDGMRSRFCAARYRVPPSGDVRWEIVVHRGASVSGTIVDEETGAPVSGVEVAAFPNVSYLASRSHLVRAVSDQEGRFVIGGLTAIWNELRVSSQEWFAPAPPPGPEMPEAPDAGLPRIASPPPIVATRAGAALALLVLPDADEPIRNLRFVVRRTGRATGTVVDASGAPVAGARVSVADGEGDAARLWPAPADAGNEAAATTDASGRFILGGVPPGNPRLVVRAPGCPPARSDPFALSPGGEARVPPVAVRSGEPVVVVVRSDQGRPVAGIGVKIYAARFPREHVGPDDVAAHTDSSGRVEIRSLPAGPICLAVENVSAEGLILAPSFRSTFVHDPARREEIQVEMVESVPVSGTIRLADGSPVAHATVIFAPASVGPEDFHAIEDMIGRGPLDWSRFGTEDGVREMSGVRVRTDAAGAFSTNVNSSRPLALRRVERWRAGEPEPIEGFEPIDAGTVLVPGGPAKVIVVQRSPKPSSSRR